ncbi:hypothetical protein CEXT_714951 [Caerostris extrusa]|uniref:Uncharacterized protein n=1 Tax=Caerostris extrusa TaxID=172846 RepID=A0AAV4N5J6_CAEEX|nr:hypothetical protein CEXT_714951 [Caerostris extrusa]
MEGGQEEVGVVLAEDANVITSGQTIFSLRVGILHFARQKGCTFINALRTDEQIQGLAHLAFKHRDVFANGKSETESECGNHYLAMNRVGKR